MKTTQNEGNPEGSSTASGGIMPAGTDVPPFEAGHSVNKYRFVWWSWHPAYPQWAQSCWGADSIREAILDLHRPLACKMRQYHNKLIRLNGDCHVEVADLPPNEDLDRWQFEVDRFFIEARKASAHPGSHPVGTESKAQASQKTAQERSVCEVERVPGLLDEAVQLIELVQMGRGKEGYLTRAKAAILMASKRLPSYPPSSEDRELLDWLESRRISDGNGGWSLTITGRAWQSFRGAIHVDRSKEAQQASTTSQKGGQGV